MSDNGLPGPVPPQRGSGDDADKNPKGNVDKPAASLVERLAARKGGEGAGPVVSFGSDAAPGTPFSQEPSGARTGGGGGFKASRGAHLSAPGGTRNVATLDLDKMQAAGFVTPDGGRSQIMEEFRAIKRPLLRRAFERGGTGRDHVIMVTSSRPGEGKSFCSINLAMSIASEHGLNVLLIDGDAVKSDLPQALGFKAETGLLDLLVDDNLDLTDVLVRTNIPNLTVLPAGNAYDHATELLAGPAMADLVTDLANRYSDRVIIFNAPPLLVSSEAGVLSSRVGQILMVVEADKTGQKDVARSLSLLETDANISFVLNKITDRRINQRYGAYSYYGKSK